MAKPIAWTSLIVPNGGIDESRSPQTIEDNKWTSAVNVEPLFDGVRSRNGSSASNAVALQAVQQAYVSGEDSREFADGTAEYISQGFQDAAEMIVSRVAVRLAVASGSPTGTVTAAIYAESTATAGEPGVVVSGAEATDFTSVNATDLSTDYAWSHFTLATAATLTAATPYHLVIGHASAAAGHTVQIEENTTPDEYASGVLAYSADAAAWTQVAAADANFRVYSGAAPINAIIDYRLSDATTSRHVVVADQEAYKNSSGTMTAISTRERAGLTADDDAHVHWAVGNDRLFLTNGTEISKKFYVSGGTEYWENEGIAAPTTGSATEAAGGSLATGTYYVDWYYWNDDIGQPSNRKNSGDDTVSVELTAGTQTIDISSLPTTPARDNDRVTHVRIELKVPGSTVYRYFTQVAIGTATASISSGTGTTDAEYTHDVPPVHSLKVIAENRQFIAGIADYPYRLQFSDIIGADSYYESFPAANYRDFGLGDGDYITALEFVPPRSLVVGCKNSVWVIDARQPRTSDRYLIGKHVGVAGGSALQVVGKKLFFISDGDKLKGPHVWEGQGEVKPLLQVDDTFKELDLTLLKYASCAHLAPGDNRHQWWTLCSSTAGVGHDRILVYDYIIGAWTLYKKDSGRVGVVLGEIQASSGITQIFLGGSEGVEHLQDSGTTDSETAYTTQLTLKAYEFGGMHLYKRLRYLEYLLKELSSSAVSLKIITDYGGSPPVVTSMLQGGNLTAFTLGTSTLGGAHTMGPGEENRIRRLGLNQLGRVFQPQIEASSAWHIKGLSFGVQPTRVRKCQ